MGLDILYGINTTFNKMTEENICKVISLPNWGYLDTHMPNDLFNSLVEECKTAQIKNNEMISALTGAGVAKHFFLKDNVDKMHIFIKKLLQIYNNHFPGLADLKVATENVPLHFDIPWINFQKKYEFVPKHGHDGVFSYTSWIKIPYDSDEELKNGGDHASCVEFLYRDILGKAQSKVIKLNKKDEGRIVFFPAPMEHIVYPFYTSDEFRISISGNILLNTKKL